MDKSATSINMGKIKSFDNEASKKGALYYLKRDWQLYALLFPGVIFYLLFRYLPMYGVVIAFKDYGIYTGILKSPWSGFKHFTAFFSSDDFIMLFKNTFLLGFFNILWSFPAPVMFAILLNEVRHNIFKKFVQTASYLPSFLSTVVVSSMVIDLISPGNGMINNIIAALGFEKQYFLIMPEWFRTIYISSDIWQFMGYNAIIYISALTMIDSALYDAAKIDGCGRLKSIWHVTLPGILPTIATMFIIKSGSMFKIGFEKVLLLYTPTTYVTADVFSTFVYRKGLLETNYSYATAVGLFESLVALAIILISNAISKRMTEQSII